MWNVMVDDMVLNASPTLDLAMDYARGLGVFVTITDGKTAIVGKFGVDEIIDGQLPDGNDYTWKMRRDEAHRSWRRRKT